MSTPPHVRLSVIVATYEWPDALDLVLTALSEQSDTRFEIVVADDGSELDTHAIVERWQAVFGDRLVHSWQADDGYRRARNLNLAALHATSRFLVFIDGDCVPRRRFVEAIRRAALPGWFLASKRLNLSADLSRRALEQRLPIWRWSALHWLVLEPGELFHSPREVARPGLLVPFRDRRRPWRPRQPEFAPPFDGYGFCLGVARDDLQRVNGFDMRFTGWGGEDVDVATRLRRAGLRCGWPGAQATMLHLWHLERKGAMSSNTALVAETASSERIESVEGLRELARALQANASRAGSA
jgi:GT2 family glycosyltransferase